MESLVNSEVQQAGVCLKENRLDEALAVLQGALAKAPDDFAANHLFGVALGKAGRRTEAIARLLTATRLNPSSAAAQTHLGMAYAGADKPDLARKAYEAALHADPDFAPAQVGLTRLPTPVPGGAAKMPAPSASADSAPTPWSATSQSQPVAAPVSQVKGSPKTAVKAGDKTLRDEIEQAEKEAKKQAKTEKYAIDWGSTLLQGGGALVFVLGIFLFLGNVLGFYPTFPGVGYITMAIGGAMWKAAW